MNATKPQLTHVYTVHDEHEATILVEALAGEGIACTIEELPDGGRPGIPNIKLLVAAADVQDARSFLVELEARFSDEEE